MNFRVTVRDNHAGGGGVNTGAMRVNVVSAADPSLSRNRVLPQTGQPVRIRLSPGTSPTPQVRRSIAQTCGCCFPSMAATVSRSPLHRALPTTARRRLVVPNTPTSTARVKVEAIGNIFFNISLPNFTITPNSTARSDTADRSEYESGDSAGLCDVPARSFRAHQPHNFSLDQRTRIMLFAVGLELMPGEDLSVVTAQAEDSAHRIFPLTVEYVGKVPNFNWLTQVNVRLPDGLSAGDVLVSVSLRGAISNKSVVRIR